MTISSRLRWPVRGRLLLFRGGVLGLCLGIGAWVAARPRLPQPEQPAAPAAAATRTGHFSGRVHFDLLAKLLADEHRSAPPNAWLQELAHPKTRVKTMDHPLLGREGPDFTLRDQQDRPWNLKSQAARGPVVLVFYLGYTCNFCVHELFRLNADLDRFQRLGGRVAAVSGDAPEFTRRRFKDYGAFGFSVLSDPGHVVARAYGVVRAARGSEPEELLHATFVIDGHRQVRWAYQGDTPFRSNMVLLYELASVNRCFPKCAAAGAPQGQEQVSR